MWEFIGRLDEGSPPCIEKYTTSQRYSLRSALLNDRYGLSYSVLSSNVFPQAGCARLYRTIRYGNPDGFSQAIDRQTLARNGFRTDSQLIDPLSPKRLIAHKGRDNRWNAGS